MKCLQLLIGGVFTQLPNDAIQKVRDGERLNIKFGIDPTRPKLHLGHFVPIRLVRQLQEMGHNVHLILGTLTAQLGDPSGRDKTRPILDEEIVKKNAGMILSQVEPILKPVNQTDGEFHVHPNHEWFEDMPLPFFLNHMASKFTVASMMARDGFKKRGGEGIAMHELIVPMLQGWDSVMVNADVEIGGTDQLFNFQVSRTLQESRGQKPQVCLMTPVINGTDGRKMSKSFDNCIFLDESPEEIFGKIMSISDEVMDEWIVLLTGLDEVPKHPMKRKKALAFDIVRQIHGEKASAKAIQHFKAKIQRGEALDIIELPSGEVINIIQAIRKCSRSEARRLIKAGGVSVDGEKISEQEIVIQPGSLLKVGKRQWCQVT